MTFGNRESQLELFDVQRQSAPRPARETVGRVLVHLRYDQAVLAGMASLIGLTVIFACGVERGKQLVRSERMLLARQESEAASKPQSPVSPSASQPRSEDPAATSSDTVTKPKSAPAPAAAPKVKTPKRLASSEPPVKPKSAAATSGSSRYAVQVVTFSQATTAKREMERLRATGERAFLIMRDGRTAVYVGPFPSKVNASDKLVDLKGRYQDCFVRTL